MDMKYSNTYDGSGAYLSARDTLVFVGAKTLATNNHSHYSDEKIQKSLFESWKTNSTAINARLLRTCHIPEAVTENSIT